MASIFLSHNSQDKPFVRRLAIALQAKGVRVWVDEAEIKIGDSLLDKIQSAIDETDYLAIVLSPHSVTSSWVKQRLQTRVIDSALIGVIALRGQAERLRWNCDRI